MQRVIAYVDGFNLYYSLKERGLKKYYWLDVQALCARLLGKGQKQLLLTKYFTSRVSSPDDKVRRQNTWIEAIGTLPGCQIFYGRYLTNPWTCRNCGNTFQLPKEKMTDVNIATQMLLDAHQNGCDLALLLTADTDLVPPVTALRTVFGKRVRVAMLTSRLRKARALIQAADEHCAIQDDVLEQCQLPDRVQRADGFSLERPRRWRQA